MVMIGEARHAVLVDLICMILETSDFTHSERGNTRALCSTKIYLLTIEEMSSAASASVQDLTPYVEVANSNWSGVYIKTRGVKPPRGVEKSVAGEGPWHSRAALQRRCTSDAYRET